MRARAILRFLGGFLGVMLVVVPLGCGDTGAGGSPGTAGDTGAGRGGSRGTAGDTGTGTGGSPGTAGEAGTGAAGSLGAAGDTGTGMAGAVGTAGRGGGGGRGGRGGKAGASGTAGANGTAGAGGTGGKGGTSGTGGSLGTGGTGVQHCTGTPTYSCATLRIDLRMQQRGVSRLPDVLGRGEAARDPDTSAATISTTTTMAATSTPGCYYDYTNYDCYGTADPCSTIPSQTTCNDQLDCSWSGTTTCSGTPTRVQRAQHDELLRARLQRPVGDWFYGGRLAAPRVPRAPLAPRGGAALRSLAGVRSPSCEMRA